jgi:hypothetical protein
VYHAELVRAFTLATGDDRTGDELAKLAESLILDRIVVPYNRLFGQNKAGSHLWGYAGPALDEFEAAVRARAPFATLGDTESRRRLSACREILRSVLESVDGAARAASDRWHQGHVFWLKQGGLVWLPLNYGLRPDQYDTQEEWNAIVGKLVGQDLTDANTIRYLLNNQFHLDLKSMIRNTRLYHCIIIHDFRGRREDGTTDSIGWDVVADGYLRGFIEAVEALDRGERTRLPQYFIFVDEHFYTVNKSRQIISYLENLYATPQVSLENKEVQAQVERAHARLLGAIRNSRTLAERSDAELRELFRVHVTVTNQFDPAFAFDCVMRDHRKIAFRDIVEEDPGSGEAIFTGQGVGEHYNGPSWEDRSIAVRGPALLDLKRSARDLVLEQGFREEEIPEPFRTRPLPADYPERCAELRRGGWRTPAVIAMNETGYAEKEATILKAAMYNLVPQDAFLLALDSLWISDFWAGMFLSAGLRGANMFAVAPASKNAPANAFPVMILMRETLDVLVDAQRFFETDLEEAGGSLRIGLYGHDVPVYDIAKRVDMFLEAREKHEFLREYMTLHPRVEELLAAVRDRETDSPVVAAGDLSSVALDSGHKPFIHMKAQFFGTREAFRVLEREEWVGPLADYLEVRLEQVRGLPNEGLTPHLLQAKDGRPSVIEGLESELSPEERERVIYFLTIGSHNQDRRSMISDGEAIVGVASYDALVALPDFMFLLGTVTWVSSREELDAVFPRVEGFWLRFRKQFHLIKDLV